MLSPHQGLGAFKARKPGLGLGTALTWL